MKIFFAGSENLNAWDKVISPTKARNVLMSYYYLRKYSKDKLEKFIKRVRDTGTIDYLFLDSGAHTFLAAYGEKKSSGGVAKKVDDPITFSEEYLDWLEQFGHLFDLVVELDIGSVLEKILKGPKGCGQKKIEEWRERMSKMGLHDKMFVVSHYQYFCDIFGDWKDEWKRMLKEYPYVAIGDGPKGGVLHNHFAIWKQLGTWSRIHGFAETKNHSMKNYPYWSIDSTSWNIGSKFGHMLIYKPKSYSLTAFGAIDRTNEDTVQKAFDKLLLVRHLLEPMTQAIKFNILFEKTDGGLHRDRQNVLAFMAFEKDIDELWSRRGVDFNKNLFTKI